MREVFRWAVIAIGLAGCRIYFDEREPDATVRRCPDRYVFVRGDTQLGTGDFCAMTFEAKALELATNQIVANGCDAACTPNWGTTGYGAVSAPEGSPFRSVNPLDAQRICRDLGPSYDLMSNREWMTIARQVESLAANWDSGTPDVGRLAQGNTNGGVAYSAVLDENDPYSATGFTAATQWDQRRTEILPDGETIWDLSGNVQEWIDFTLGGAFDPPPSCTAGQLPTITCPGLTYDDFQSTAGTLDSTNGAGFLIGGSGNSLRRGGQSSDYANGFAGIYALNMNRFTTDTFAGTGFRCVQRL